MGQLVSIANCPFTAHFAVGSSTGGRLTLYSNWPSCPPILMAEDGGGGHMGIWADGLLFPPESEKRFSTWQEKRGGRPG